VHYEHCNQSSERLTRCRVASSCNALTWIESPRFVVITVLRSSGRCQTVLDGEFCVPVWRLYQRTISTDVCMFVLLAITTSTTATYWTRCGWSQSRFCRSVTATSCQTLTADELLPFAPESWYAYTQQWTFAQSGYKFSLNSVFHLYINPKIKILILKYPKIFCETARKQTIFWAQRFREGNPWILDVTVRVVSLANMWQRSVEFRSVTSFHFHLLRFGPSYCRT